MQEKVHDYDIVGHPQADFHFTVVFPFHRNPSIPGGGMLFPAQLSEYLFSRTELAGWH